MPKLKRERKKKTKPDAPGAMPGIGDNSGDKPTLTDDQRRELFLHHRTKWNIEFDYVTNAQIKSYGWFDIVNAGYGYTFGNAAKRAERKLHGPAFQRLWRRFIELFQ